MNDNFAPFDDDDCYAVKCAVCDNMCNDNGDCDNCIYNTHLTQKQEESIKESSVE